VVRTPLGEKSYCADRCPGGGHAHVLQDWHRRAGQLEAAEVEGCGEQRSRLPNTRWPVGTYVPYVPPTSTLRAPLSVDRTATRASSISAVGKDREEDGLSTRQDLGPAVAGLTRGIRRGQPCGVPPSAGRGTGQRLVPGCTMVPSSPPARASHLGCVGNQPRVPRPPRPSAAFRRPRSNPLSVRREERLRALLRARDEVGLHAVERTDVETSVRPDDASAVRRHGDRPDAGEAGQVHAARHRDAVAGVAMIGRRRAFKPGREARRREQHGQGRCHHRRREDDAST
jgi:hypothetical protein